MIRVLWLIFLCGIGLAIPYNELLTLRPLERNKLLGLFEFNVESQPSRLIYYNDLAPAQPKAASHYMYFPHVLGPIIETSNTRELHLRFTQGWWDNEEWGKLPYNGRRSGGTGVEVWAVIEADSYKTAKQDWRKLTSTLSGLFCASLNFIDESITTIPNYHASQKPNQNVHVTNPSHDLYLLRAVLPSEPICTENLTPFLKLLPTRGKAGISTLLDGHKVFDSLWHSMSIDMNTVCEGTDCKLQMTQSVNTVIDVLRSLRRKNEGGIPKPTPGEKLRCDESKTYNVWQCFPLGDPTDVAWSLEEIFGRPILGAAFELVPGSTKINIEVDPKNWSVSVIDSKEQEVEPKSIDNGLSFDIQEPQPYDVKFSSPDSSKVLTSDSPPIKVARSLTGYSQDRGGLRTHFSNPTTSDRKFVYFEFLPWFMRLHLNTLKVSFQDESGTSLLSPEGENQYIHSRFYKPAIDRKRPSHLELSIVLPPKLTLVLTYEFETSLLLYAEYPPDANHGFAVEAGMVTVLNENDDVEYEIRTSSLLLTLPTPDFSMPYNVIILTCTIMSLAFGTVYNLLTKKVITEEELEVIAAQGKLAKLKEVLQRRFKVAK